MPQMEPAGERSRRAAALIGGGQAAGVGLASLFTAAVSYVVLVIAARTLTSSDNAVFLTYWAVLFGAYGVVSGLNPESARAAFAGAMTVRARSPRLVAAASGFGLVISGVLGLSGLFWGARVLDADHAWLVGVVAVSCWAFCGQLGVSGVVASRRHWNAMLSITVADGAVRLAAVVVAYYAFRSLSGIAVAGAVSSCAWVALLYRKDVRAALRARGDVPWGLQWRRFAHACAASASSAALAVGFPVLVRLTSTHSEYRGAAGLLLAITLTRAPLMVPLTSYQSVALTHFLRHRDTGARALFPIAGAVLGVTVVGALVAAVVGPPLFELLLGGEYEASGGLLSALTVAAGLLALLTLTGACCLALERHRGFSAGWVVGTCAAVVVLLLPLDLEARTVLSLITAPVCGVAVHAWTMASHARAATATG